MRRLLILGRPGSRRQEDREEIPAAHPLSGLRPGWGHRLHQRPHPGQAPRGSGFLAVSGGLTPCVLNSSFSSLSSVASYPLLSLTCQSHREWKLGGEMIKPEGKLYLWSNRKGLVTCQYAVSVILLSFYLSVKIFIIRMIATGLLSFLHKSQTTAVQVPLRTIRQY